MADPLTLLAALPLESGVRWGEAAVDVQWADARAVLDLDGPRRHFLTRSRGYSKTTDLGAIALVELAERAPAGAQLYAVAADRDQAALLVREVRGFVRRAPRELWRDGPPAVDTFRATAANGATLTALAADAASSWGLRPWLVVADEVAMWGTTSGPRLLWDAIYSAVAKRPDSRLVALTTAGAPSHWTRRILDAARSSDRWHVHEVEGPAPWITPADLAEQEALLLPSVYARLWLNRWTEPEDRVSTLSDIEACVAHDGPLGPTPGRRAVVGLDVGLTNDRTVVATCSTARGEPIRLDRLDVFQGRKDHKVDLQVVEDLVLECANRWRARVVLDPFQAVALAQRLRRKHVKVDEFTFTSASANKLAVGLFRLLKERRLDLPDDRDLIDELATVKLVERAPGVYRLDHEAGRHDDRAIALALAATAVADEPERRPAMAHTAAAVRIGRPRSYGAFSGQPVALTAWRR